ncbi:hypothetical protein [Nitrosomonas sp.]|nr:hypothetical protein [Nitrosomonas sp.]
MKKQNWQSFGNETAAYKFLWQGMPVKNLKAAIDWRKRNLNHC